MGHVEKMEDASADISSTKKRTRSSSMSDEESIKIFNNNDKTEGFIEIETSDDLLPGISCNVEDETLFNNQEETSDQSFAVIDDADKAIDDKKSKDTFSEIVQKMEKALEEKDIGTCKNKSPSSWKERADLADRKNSILEGLVLKLKCEVAEWKFEAECAQSKLKIAEDELADAKDDVSNLNNLLLQANDVLDNQADSIGSLISNLKLG